MQDFKTLHVWRRSFDFGLRIYILTKAFPTDERYGLTSQLRRASISIAINIAEGAGKGSNRDFAHFIKIAEGSANEVECELLFAQEFGYLAPQDADDTLTELAQIKKMMNNFRKRLLESENK